MLTESEAQELHELIGSAIEATRSGNDLRDPADHIAGLERARELAAVIVADSMPETAVAECVATARERLATATQLHNARHPDALRDALRAINHLAVAIELLDEKTGEA